MAIFSLINSCVSPVNQKYDSCAVQIRALPNDNTSMRLRISDLVRDVQFIPIKSDTELRPTGPIARYCNGFYYIKDGESQNIIKISENGTISGRIGSQGRASNEYLDLTTFDINSSTFEVYIYDSQRNTMIIYSNSGEFVRSFCLDDTKGMFDDFAVFPNGNIIGCDFSYTGIKALRGVWMVDSEGNFLKQVVPVEKSSRYYVNMGLPFICRADTETVFVMGPIGDDSIYKIDSEGNVIKRYIFDFGTQISRRDLRKEASVPLLDYFYMKTGFSIYPNFINIWLSKGDDRYEVTYNLTEGKCTVIPSKTEMIIRDVPNYCGGVNTGGCRSLNFCDAEHLPSDIPNPDSTSLWMVVTHLK